MSNKSGERLYVQSVVISMEKPNGEITARSFIGLAIASKEEWDEMKKQKIGKSLKSKGNNPPIMFEEPKPVERILTDNPELENIVDIIREDAHKYFGSEDE